MPEQATVYKLTTRDRTTYCGFQWVVGEWVKTDGNGELCSEHWTHWYDSPEVASFMNPAHAHVNDPICWRGETRGKRLDDHGLKCGVTEGRILEQIPLPEITSGQRAEIAIRCALAVCKEPTFTRWAQSWLDGSDRSASAAWAAWAAASAAWAAWAAASAAEAAAWAASAAEAAAWAASAAKAGEAAAWAAWAAEGTCRINLHDVICGVIYGEKSHA